MRGKMSLQNKIFLSSSLLLVVSLMLTGWLINAISTNDTIDNSLRNTRRELALVANNLDTAISHVSDYAISIAVDSRVIGQTKQYPGLPKTQTERYQLRSTLGSSISTIMGLNRTVYMWDLVSRENTFFGCERVRVETGAESFGRFVLQKGVRRAQRDDLGSVHHPAGQQRHPGVSDHEDHRRSG